MPRWGFRMCGGASDRGWAMFRGLMRRSLAVLEVQVLRLIGVADFLSLKVAPAAGADSAGIA